METTTIQAEINGLKGKALRARYEEATGKTTKSQNRPWLVKATVAALLAGASKPAPAKRADDATDASFEPRATGKDDGFPTDGAEGGPLAEQLLGHAAKGAKTQRPATAAAKTAKASKPAKAPKAKAEKKPAAKKEPKAKKAPAAKGERDARLPKAGTVLERECGGKTHKVTVLEDGFRYGGKEYKSLSKIATEIAGCAWNGFTFFKLQAYVTAKKD